MISKQALITGISGQDGSYLAKLLLSKGYKVIGIVRDKGKFSFNKLKILGIDNDVIIEEVSLLDYEKLKNIFYKYNFNLVFNFASQSSVGLSYFYPKDTIEFNIQSVVNLLECIRLVDKKIKFFQASSGEIFGNVDEKNLPVDENTPLNPKNLYAISKSTAQRIIAYYSEYYELYISSAIFLNHESILRNENFVIKKIVRDLVRIRNGKLDKLSVGNIDTKRDFGYAPKYVEAVFSMMFLDKGDSFVISSGNSLSIRELIYYTIDKLSLSRDVIEIDKSLFRNNDTENIFGDSSKAASILKWNYSIDFFDVVDELIEFEISNSVN